MLLLSRVRRMSPWTLVSIEDDCCQDHHSDRHATVLAHECTFRGTSVPPLEGVSGDEQQHTLHAGRPLPCRALLG